MKTITLGELLKLAHHLTITTARNPYCAYAGAWASDADTPEDALQALAEAVCGPDTVLVIPTSARAMEVMRAEARETLVTKPKLHRENWGWVIDEIVTIEPGKAEALYRELQDRLPQLSAQSVLLPKGALDGPGTIAAAETRPCETSREEEGEPPCTQ